MKGPKLWHVQFKYGQQHDYEKPGGVITYCNKQFEDLQSFNRVFNKAGTLIVDNVKTRVAGIDSYFEMNPELNELEIVETFDHYNHQKVMLRIWKDRK